MKKIIALILTVVTIVCVSSFCVIASENAAVVEVTNVESKAGESVNVTVSLKNCTDITSLSVKLNYDSSVLALESGKCLVGNTIINQVDVKNNVALFKFDGINADVNGDIFEFTFAIDKNAKAGTYEISFDRIVIKQLLENKEVDISTDAKTGIITIIGDEVETTTEKETTTIPETTTEKETTTVTETTTEKETTTVPETTSEDDTEDDTEEPTTKDRIPETGDSNVIALIAGVCVLSAAAFVATRKKHND